MRRQSAAHSKFLRDLSKVFIGYGIVCRPPNQGLLKIFLGMLPSRPLMPCVAAKSIGKAYRLGPVLVIQALHGFLANRAEVRDASLEQC